MADGNNSNSAIWVAVIGMVTTISGGVFTQWDKIFPPTEAAAPETEQAAEASASDSETAEVQADAASDAPEDPASEAAAEAASGADQ